jgi:hypothetical protein
MMMTSAEKVSSPPEIWNPEPLVAVLNEYNRKHSGNQPRPIVEWIQYFKPFPKNVIDKLIAVLKNKTDNEQTLIMTRLTEMKDNHTLGNAVQNYILGL